MYTINKVLSSDNFTKPVIVDFQNGQVQAGEETNLQSGLFKNKFDKMKVAIKSTNMLYLGNVDKNEDLFNTFILVHNRRTNKIRLIQADHATVSPQIERKSHAMDTSVTTFDSSMAELNKTFGSKKTKRHTEQQERLKMNIDTVKEQLERTVADITIDESDLAAGQPDENDSLYRPPINREASTRVQVYSLNDLVPENVLESLAEEAANVLQSDLTANEYELLPFVQSNILKLQESNGSETSILKSCCILLYINYLLKFIMTPMKKVTRRFVICTSSELVNSHVLDNFSVDSNSGRTRPLSMKDKSLCSILIMTILAMDYEVNIEELSKDIKMGTKKISEVCRVLGLSSGKNKSIVTLKLPLPPPVSLTSKRKRK